MALLAATLAPGVARAGSVDITDLRTWSAPDNSRMVLDLSGDSSYRVRREGNPERLVVEIKGAKPRTPQTAWGPVDGRIRAVTMETTSRGTRVTVELTGEARFKHFALAPYHDKPHRIVLDVLGPRREEIAAAPAPQPVAVAPPPLAAAPRGRPFVVAIDAGHGGEDPGALGRYYRTREKDVVLKIARYVREELAAMPAMRPHLTRDGDYFIPLGERVRKADHMGADLFVSIHADTSRNRRTRGTHVYTLAPRTSADRSAVRVARMENASDLVGGVEDVAAFPMIFDSNGSPNNVVESRVLSHLAYKRFGEVNVSGRDGRRSEARFWVLKGRRPSMLVETGFLSNKDDERALRSEAFQRSLARQIAFAVRDYYQTRVNTGTVTYTVQRGDTLSEIARRFGVSVADITGANDLGSASRIMVGSRLNVPVRGARPAPGQAKAVTVAMVKPATAPLVEPEARKADDGPLSALGPTAAEAADTLPQLTEHTVRRGDNSTRIARRYGVRLADLLAANRLGKDDGLLVGQRLVIPLPRTGDKVHVVRAGESLSGLAQQYGVSLSELAQVNDLRGNARLYRGQPLIVPGVAFASASEPVDHLVRGGETLSGLAEAYSVSVSDLAQANDLSTRAMLLKGQHLVIPADAATALPAEHVVGSGETLSGLAQHYGMPLSDLARANNLSTGARLLRGQRLLIPGAATASAPEPAAPARPKEHVVHSGETLSGLALHYGVRLSDLARANNLSTRARLLKGQRLLVPTSSGPRIHVIRDGESLVRIARRYDVPVERLLETNRIRNADHVEVGRRLVIPD